MDVSLRAPHARDFEFARALYFETMRSMIELLFGWDQTRQEENFAGWFKLDEVSIVTVDGIDAGWIQQRAGGGEIFLGSIYVVPSIQGQGIGTRVLRSLLASARMPVKSGHFGGDEDQSGDPSL